MGVLVPLLLLCVHAGARNVSSSFGAPVEGAVTLPAPAEPTHLGQTSTAPRRLPEGLIPVPAAWLPLLIFCARVLDVSVGTFRLICITRGRQLLAIVLALVEVTIWLLAVASVITHLNNWLNILAYVTGFTTGNALGMWLERRLALGVETVILISILYGEGMQ